MSITRAIAEHARRLPEEPALLFDGGGLTRRELDEAVARLAAFIAARTGRNAGVALDLPNGLPLVLLFLAATAAGRNAQIIDHEWPLATARKVVASLKPGLVVSAREGLKGAVVLPPDADIGELMDTLDVPRDFRRVADPDPDTVFYTGFTSGSTGAPKGFLRDHRSWLESFAAAQDEFGLTAADCVYAPGPFSHSMPLYALVSALHAGARAVLPRRVFQAHAAVRTLARRHVTVLSAVPTQIMVMIEAAEASKTFCHEVRIVLTSGAKWPPSLTKRLKKIFPNAVLAEFYGASELSFVTLARSDERVPKNSVGRPFPGVKVSIRDPKGKSLGRDRTGFVFVESPLVFSGYAAGRDGLLRAGNAVSVGDRGRLDQRGFLFLEGRADRLLVTSGRNVQAEEVEAVLDSHPEIAASAVLGVPDRKRGTRLVGIINLRANARVSSASLVKHLRKVLPPYKMPTRFAVADTWPRTRSGKTDLAKLEKMWAAGKCEAIE